MIPIVVRQGDHLAGLAWRHGFDADAVWQHEENRALRAIRTDPLVLAAGDILFIPSPQRKGMRFVAGTTNRYVAAVPRLDVHLVVHDHLGTPLPDEPYVVEGLADPTERRTGPGGEVTLSVPVTVREVALSLVRRNIRALVRVGDLDPIEETAGVAGRLANLGFLESSSVTDEQLREAVSAFQRWTELHVTGAVDEPTRDALQRTHGS